MRREITINLPADTDPLFAQALLELDRDSLIDLLLGRGELIDANIATKPHPRGRFTAAKVAQLQAWSLGTEPFDEFGGNPHNESDPADFARLARQQACLQAWANPVDLDHLLDQAAMFGTIDDVLDALTEADPKAAKSVSMYYGLGDDDPQTNAQIGSVLGVTGQACRVYKERGLKKLRKMLAQ